jgi:chromosome segregation ATPase
MDVETAEAITTLRADIRRVETTLSDRINTLNRQFDDLGGKVDDLRGRLDATASSLRDEMRQIGQESKRHAEVLFESLRDDFRIVAEGLVSLGAKVELLLPPDRRH